MQRVKKFAFIISEYPLIISLDVKCDDEHQAVAAGLFRNVFGDCLLTKRMGQAEELPSPEQLKRKIILSLRADEDLHEEIIESAEDHFVGEVWFISNEEDAREENTSRRGWKKRDMILKGNTLYFQTQTPDILTEMSNKSFFVGVMTKSNIEAFMREVASEKTFLMYCNQDHSEFRVVVKKKKDLFHFKVNYNESTKKYSMETRAHNL